MIHVSNVTKILGGQTLFTNAHFQINAGEKVGLVGPNGAGKTTFFRLITGEERPDEGQIGIQGQTRIAYFSQSVGEMKGKTALQEVIDGNVEVSILSTKLFG